jgi:hypothetical protein
LSSIIKIEKIRKLKDELSIKNEMEKEKENTRSSKTL